MKKGILLSLALTRARGVRRGLHADDDKRQLGDESQRNDEFQFVNEYERNES